MSRDRSCQGQRRHLNKGKSFHARVAGCTTSLRSPASSVPGSYSLWMECHETEASNIPKLRINGQTRVALILSSMFGACVIASGNFCVRDRETERKRQHSAHVDHSNCHRRRTIRVKTWTHPRVGLCGCVPSRAAQAPSRSATRNRILRTALVRSVETCPDTRGKRPLVTYWLYPLIASSLLCICVECMSCCGFTRFTT